MFQKGNKASVGHGRPKAQVDFSALVRTKYCPAALKRVVALAQCDDKTIALNANKLLLAYGFGKPPEEVKISGDKNAPLQIEIVRVKSWIVGDSETH